MSPALGGAAGARTAPGTRLCDPRSKRPIGRGFAELVARIDRRTARVGVVGLGSVGLPLARGLVSAGFEVQGFEIDRARRERIERGETPLHHLPASLALELRASGRFAIAPAPLAKHELDVALVCVPTPLDARGEPDLGPVLDAARALALALPRGALVVLESTCAPGTTRREFAAEFARAGFAPSADLWLAHSPEREDPGRRDLPSASIAKLVGGLDERSGELAERLYATCFERVVRVSSAEVAEAAKLHENVYRAVNIALANELKTVCEALGLDPWEVIAAASTKPFGFEPFEPGPGVGGACIPVDPVYLSSAARVRGTATPLADLAGAINAAMPARVVERVGAELAARGRPLAGARVLVLGLAYKRDVDVVTGSPAVEIAMRLERAGAYVACADPHVARAPRELGFRARIELDARTIAAFDAVVVATDHAAFDWDLVARHAALVVDTRNALGSRMAGRAGYVRA